MTTESQEVRYWNEMFRTRTKYGVRGTRIYPKRIRAELRPNFTRYSPSFTTYLLLIATLLLAFALLSSRHVV